MADNFNNDTKSFWTKRADRYDSLTYKVTNLEEDDDLQRIKMLEEKKKIEKYSDNIKNKILLDLGSGVGYWSFYFAKYCSQVVAVDYIDSMNDIARQRAKEYNINNIKFIDHDVVSYQSDRKYDYIFISGLLLYLDDKRIIELLDNITTYVKFNSKIILREPIGINGRYEISNQYSEQLKVNYNAIYRSNDELIKLFEHIRFKLVRNEDMYEHGSQLNKWNETKLRIYLLKNNS